MRAFRFRLASLQRLKRHRIEEKEREIVRLQAEIESRLDDIEAGRNRLAEFRRIFLEETPEIHSVEVEYIEASVRAYILSVEAAKFREIGLLRKQEEARRKELITLYQEEKMLDRLRERQLATWQREAQREEIYLLDEMGGQAHHRRREPAGGTMLVMLGVVAVIAVAGVILVLKGKHQPILERLGLAKPTVTEAAPPEIPSATPEAGLYTIRDLYGDPNRPANEVLRNLLETRNRLQTRERMIEEQEARLKAEREALVQSEKHLADRIRDVSEELETLKKAQQEEQDRLKSLYMLRVTEISNVIQKMKPRGAAELLTQMWTSSSAEGLDPKEVALDVFRQIPAAKRNKVLDELVKSSKGEAAQMVLRFIQLEPTGTPTPQPGS